MTVTVNPVDDQTVADDTQVTTPEDTKATIQPTATDPDNPVTFQLMSGPAHGTVTEVLRPLGVHAGRELRRYRFVHLRSRRRGLHRGQDRLHHRDAGQTTAPTASDTSATTNEDTAKVITPPTNDVDGDAVELAIESGPAHGTAVQARGEVVPLHPGRGLTRAPTRSPPAPRTEQRPRPCGQ